MRYPQPLSEPRYFDHLTITDGLSHNSVYRLLQDHWGYIWIGTQNGLNKYAGYDLGWYITLFGESPNDSNGQSTSA